MKKICSSNTFSLAVIILVAILIIIGSVVAYYEKGYNEGYSKCLKELEDKYSSPVEKNVIETCYITRDSIINNVKYITRVQHDTIEKIYFLDDSTTVNLFYKLVSE